jgi:hypothetical protein
MDFLNICIILLFIYLFFSKLLYFPLFFLINTPARPRQKISEEKTETHVDKKMKELWNIEKVKQRIYI